MRTSRRRTLPARYRKQCRGRLGRSTRAPSTRRTAVAKKHTQTTSRLARESGEQGARCPRDSCSPDTAGACSTSRWQLMRFERQRCARPDEFANLLPHGHGPQFPPYRHLKLAGRSNCNLTTSADIYYVVNILLRPSEGRYCDLI